MSNRNLFEIELKGSPCIEGISEDALRQLVDALIVRAIDDEFKSIVRAATGVEVFVKSSKEITVKEGGDTVNILPSVGIFKGVPSSSNPGAGWEIDEDATLNALNQPADRNQWTLFIACRVSSI